MQLTEIEYNEYLTEVTEALDSGGFLTVQNSGELNTMTIGWASLGIIWRVPMLLVLVRESRHTFKLIEKADEFTVSIPFSGLEEELEFCGSRSGRNYDKFAECDLEKLSGNEVHTPLIGGCDVHYECSLEYSQSMDKELVKSEVLEDCYPDWDMHTLYFGRILNCLREETG
ncbi:flavin reductase family protein [Halarsenatibacter silvermanii]|uniref:Flavin reductase like domain-containing protein n=1 Tax=Halarsenatibacter silvermanii TaxID=321763 RepID=A0A1G9H8X8_9FIRM|nr:flavin reductase family protein [Halarsenatibacter silvermanii]SDL09317.1 Flavin reductase like domain-containing protein [Halarsenatibacter silvermanii]